MPNEHFFRNNRLLYPLPNGVSIFNLQSTVLYVNEYLAIAVVNVAFLDKPQAICESVSTIAHQTKCLLLFN